MQAKRSRGDERGRIAFGAGSRPILRVFPFERHLSWSIIRGCAGRGLAVHAVEDFPDRGDIAVERAVDQRERDQLQHFRALAVAVLGLAAKRGAQCLAHRLVGIAAVGRRIVAHHVHLQLVVGRAN
jgi:hypothetical protein